MLPPTIVSSLSPERANVKMPFTSVALETALATSSVTVSAARIVTELQRFSFAGTRCSNHVRAKLNKFTC